MKNHEGAPTWPRFTGRQELELVIRREGCPRRYETWEKGICGRFGYKLEVIMLWKHHQAGDLLTNSISLSSITVDLAFWSNEVRARRSAEQM
jgi:hypothetical protein